MKEEIVSFKTAELAKEKGFPQNLEIPFKYNKRIVNMEELNELPYQFFPDYRISAPSQSLLQKWLREVHNCIVEVLFNKEENINKITYMVTVDYYKPDWSNLSDESDFVAISFNTYEEALETGLQEALKLI